MLHYHGTPITPVDALYELAGRCFCVSFARPDSVRRVHQIGQSVMLDNGAYSLWRRGARIDWPGYYGWCDRWLDYPTTWAVVPDVIDGTEAEQERLLAVWPHGKRQGAPVWHVNESIDRLLGLIDAGWPRVCMGSAGEYATVLSENWERRMDDVWNALARTFHRTPYIHLLRGMRCCGRRWPFASADSTDVAQNHHALHNSARALAQRWDMRQCPGRWNARNEQEELCG